MSRSDTADNTVLVLYPPRVNGQTEPVIGAHIGVPLVAYDLVTDGLGAHVLVDPPLRGEVEAGDVLSLWLNDETSAVDAQTIQDPNVRWTLRIPRGRLHPDRVNLLTYTVTRGSANQGTSEPPLEILYNRIRPGLRDEMDVPGGHSELKLELPDAIKNGVGPDFVSAQVCVSYPYCRAYDRITLSCNGELMDANVGAGQAPQPPNPGSEVPITVCFTVTRAYLDQAKRLDKQLNFRFTVTDQIGNGPDTNEPWSPVQRVDEDLDGTQLPMPILLERMADFPGDDASIIDLEKLAGNPLLVVVVTADNRFQVGDIVTASYTARLAGQPDVVVLVSGPVEADPFGAKKTCVLNIANDQVIANSDVTVTYQLRRPNGDLVGNAKTATAKVTGEAAPELKAPSIKEASGNTLDPLAARNTLTAVVDPGLKIGDIITLTWTGAPGTAAGGSHTASPKTVTTLGAQEIALPGSVLAFNLGKTVTVTYTVTRSGKTTNSPALSVNVQSLPQSALVQPTITQAANNGEGAELDVGSLTGNGVARMGVWPFIALGQPVWLALSGTNADGSIYRKEPWKMPGAATNSTWINQGFYTAAIPLAELQNLKHGSELSMQFKAGLGGSQVESEAVSFPVRSYTVNAVEDVKPRIASIEDSKGTEIPDGGTTIETSVVLTGAASKGQKVQVFDGTASKGEATADATTGIWTLTVSSLTVAAHSYTAKALYGSGATSAARTLTVIAVVAPTITSVKGLPSNDEIDNGGTTFSTTLILSGKASNGQKVQVLDGTTDKGQPSVDVATGIWTLTVTELSVAEHSFTVKALYGTGQTSAERTLTVAAMVIPTITSLFTSPRNDYLPNGGSTGDTTVTLTGKAANGQKVQVLDGTVEKGQPVAHTTTGIWTQVITGLSTTRHDFTAKAVYGTEAPSAVWTVTVVALAPMRPPVITGARLTDSGAPIYPGGNANGNWVSFFGTCTPRPYPRQMHVHSGNGGGYGSNIQPNSSNWECTHTGSIFTGPHQMRAVDEGLQSNIFVISYHH